MKILSLSLRNINSLAGNFSVDFTHPPFLNSGIFLITGPTGSGKTSLLDAIAFALYGATPRQGNISASVNEVMSRDFRDCAATVVFEHEGQRYAVSTASQRAKGQNPFAPNKRRLESISPEGEHKTLADKGTDVKRIISEVTGMPDVDAFCRCMLLSQGDFKEFLTMKEDKRAELLSTITQTEKYARIGTAVHERWREAEDEYNNLKAEEELTAEERTAMEATARAQTQARESAAATLTATENALRWWEEDKTLRAQHAAAQEAHDRAAHAAEAFADSGELHRLEAARRAAELAPTEQARQRETLRRQKQETELAATCDALSALTPQLEAAEKARAAAQEAEDAARPAIAALRLRIEQELRPAEQQLRTDLALLAERKTQAQKAEAAFEQKDKASQEAAQALLALRARHQETERRLGELQQDAELPERLSDIKAGHQAWGMLGSAAEQTLPATTELNRRLDALLTDKQHVLGAQEPAFYRRRAAELADLQQTAAALADRRARLAAADEEKDRAEQELHALEEPFAQANDRLTNSRKKESLLTELAELDELMDDCYHKFCAGEYEVCPCCGSKTPGIRPSVGKNQLTEARKLTQEAQKALQTLEKQMKSAKLRLSAAIATRETLTADSEQWSRRLAEQLRDMGLEEMPADIDAQRADAETRARRGEELLRALRDTELQCRAATARDALHALLRPFSAELPATVTESKKLLDALERRSKEYTNLRNEQQNFAPLEEVKAKAADAAREAAAQADIERKAAAARAETQQRNCDAQAADLRRRWQNKTADELTKECLTKETALRRAAAQSTDTLVALKSKETELTTRRRTQEQTLQELRHTEADLIARFEQLLQEKGFADEEAYRAALLPDKQIKELADTQTRLRDACTAAVAKLATLQHALEQHTAKQPSQDSQEVLLARRETEKAQLTAAETQLVETLAALKVDDDKKERNRSIEAEKKILLEKRERWALLKSILGNAQDSFQKYAQAITFDALINSANRHLRTLYPRFTLRQSDHLGLSVEDSYLEEHDTRTVSNLSGGESFIVSLALALGLSGLRNSRVSIDTLFLDEGFGTLDPENLQRVLQALEQLRMDGKLIGIITHVEGMKESFGPACTLQVDKLGTGGYSTLLPHPAVKAAPQSPGEEEAPKRRGRKPKAAE